VRVTIDAASIDTRNAQRDAHLRRNDFLAMDEFPQITFVSTGVVPVDESTFEGAAQDPYGDQRIGFDGSVTISRTDYGITWNTALETGGVLVSDTVILEFEVSAIQND
jgi:polyisoprenoid-binding protein YceI